jgi:hypothetical protein
MIDDSVKPLGDMLKPTEKGRGFRGFAGRRITLSSGESRMLIRIEP